MKLYEFSFTRKGWGKPMLGGVQADNLVQWFFDNAPYGLKLVKYKEVGQAEFAKLTDFTQKFTTEMVLDGYRGSY